MYMYVFIREPENDDNAGKKQMLFRHSTKLIHVKKKKTLHGLMRSCIILLGYMFLIARSRVVCLKKYHFFIFIYLQLFYFI